MNAPPSWFRVVAIVALLWNLLGCVAFFLDFRLSPDDLAKLSAAQQALYAARPGWAIAATAIAVFGGVLGCIGVLLRKKWAFAVLVLSLLGILVQDFGLFVLADGADPGWPGCRRHASDRAGHWPWSRRAQSPRHCTRLAGVTRTANRVAPSATTAPPTPPYMRLRTRRFSNGEHRVSSNHPLLRDARLPPQRHPTVDVEQLRWIG